MIKILLLLVLVVVIIAIIVALVVLKAKSKAGSGNEVWPFYAKIRFHHQSKFYITALLRHFLLGQKTRPMEEQSENMVLFRKIEV